MPHTKNHLSVLYVAVFLLSLNGLFSKLIPLDAISITQLRSVIAVITLLCFALIGRRGYRLSGLREYAGVYLLGVILGLHWITFFYAMQISTVAIGMLSLFTYPVITVFLEPLFNKVKIKAFDLIAVVMVFLGIMIMLGEDLNEFDSSAMQGVLWGVISAVLFSIRNLMQKYKHPNVPSDKLILHQVVMVSVILLMFVDIDTTLLFNVYDWMLLILLGVISTATAHSLLSYSLKYLSAKTVATISCLQPVLAAIFAGFVLNEIPNGGVIVGGFIIVSVAFYESVSHIKSTKS